MNRFVLLVVLILVPVTAHAADHPPFGRYQGEGRACFGALFLRSKTIEWNATYSQCGPSPYSMVNLGPTPDGKRQYLFKLKSYGPKCKTPLIKMTFYSENAGVSLNWAVDGYVSNKNWNAPNRPPDDGLYTCGLSYYYHEKPPKF